MDKNQYPLHVISGLPRSGSTLLSALLSQNPQLNTGISSPLLPSILAVRDSLNNNDFLASSLITEDEQLSLYKSMISGYFSSYGKNKNTIIDTNRLWTSNLSLLGEISPGSKVIACVRNVAEIFDSFERLFQKNPLVMPKFFSGPAEWNSIYTRFDALTNQGRVIGAPYLSLKEGVYGDFSNKILIVDYDILASSPIEVLKCIYEFLEMPYFTGHSSKNVELKSEIKDKISKFDENLGSPDLHQIKPNVAYSRRASTLPPELLERASKLDFWNSLSDTNAKLLKRA